MPILPALIVSFAALAFGVVISKPEKTERREEESKPKTRKKRKKKPTPNEKQIEKMIGDEVERRIQEHLDTFEEDDVEEPNNPDTDDEDDSDGQQKEE